VAVTGNQVVVNASGKLGVVASSKRLKEAIKPMDKASKSEQSAPGKISRQQS
jgi:hypothetical protein